MLSQVESGIFTIDSDFPNRLVCVRYPYMAYLLPTKNVARVEVDKKRDLHIVFWLHDVARPFLCYQQQPKEDALDMIRRALSAKPIEPGAKITVNGSEIPYDDVAYITVYTNSGTVYLKMDSEMEARPYVFGRISKDDFLVSAYDSSIALKSFTPLSKSSGASASPRKSKNKK